MNIFNRVLKTIKIISRTLLVIIFISTITILIVLYNSFKPTFETVDFLWQEPFDKISDLEAAANNIIRAEIISSHTNVTSFGDTFKTFLSFIEYEIRILDIFQGYVEVGDTIKVIQYTQARRYFMDGGHKYLREESNVNYTPLEVGDDLILFLLVIPDYIFSSDYPNHFISKQSAYYYITDHDRFDQVNSIFKSVDESNDLILTENDLLNIR